jgi:hypothetical protein
MSMGDREMAAFAEGVCGALPVMVAPMERYLLLRQRGIAPLESGYFFP